MVIWRYVLLDLRYINLFFCVFFGFDIDVYCYKLLCENDLVGEYLFEGVYVKLCIFVYCGMCSVFGSVCNFICVVEVLLLFWKICMFCL